MKTTPKIIALLIFVLLIVGINYFSACNILFWAFSADFSEFSFLSRGVFTTNTAQVKEALSGFTSNAIGLKPILLVFFIQNFLLLISIDRGFLLIRAILLKNNTEIATYRNFLLTAFIFVSTVLIVQLVLNSSTFYDFCGEFISTLLKFFVFFLLLSKNLSNVNYKTNTPLIQNFAFFVLLLFADALRYFGLIYLQIIFFFIVTLVIFKNKNNYYIHIKNYKKFLSSKNILPAVTIRYHTILTNTLLYTILFAGMILWILYDKTSHILFLTLPFALYLLILVIFTIAFEKKGIHNKLIFPIVFLPFTFLFLLVAFPNPKDTKEDKYNYAVLDENGERLNRDSITLPQEKIAVSNRFLYIKKTTDSLDISRNTFVKLLTISEDGDFFNQNDIAPNKTNWHGFALSAIYRILMGDGGGSNINCQVIRNITGNKTNDLARKISEQLCSIQLSSKYTKEQILNLYLNQADFCGKTTKGLESGLFRYIKKPISQLNELEILFCINTLKYVDGKATGELDKEGDSVRLASFYKLVKNFNPADYNPNERYAWDDIASYNDVISKTLKLYIDKNPYFRSKLSPVELARLKALSVDFKNTTNTEFSNTFFTNTIPKTKDPFFDNKKSTTYISTISKQNLIKINVAVAEFETKNQTILRKTKNDTTYKICIGSIVFNTKGEILGHYSNLATADMTDKILPIGSLAKPIFMCEYFDEKQVSNPAYNCEAFTMNNSRGPSIYFPKDHNGYDGRLFSLRKVIGRSTNSIANLIDSSPKTTQLLDAKLHSVGIEQVSEQDGYGRYGYPYILGQTRKMTLLQLARVYQSIFNGGKYSELTIFKEKYNPFDQITTVNRRGNGKQLFMETSCDAVKDAMQGGFDNGGTLQSATSILGNGIFYGKTGTTQDSRYRYALISDGINIVLTIVTYGEIDEANAKFGNVEMGTTNYAIEISAGIYKKLFLE